MCRRRLLPGVKWLQDSHQETKSQKEQLKLNQTKFDSKIQVVCVNVNGFRNKIGQIRRFLSNQKQETVLVMNDTRLRGKLKKHDLPGYQVLRKDKPLVGTTATAGGVAFAIPSRWSCLEYEFKTKEDHFEALAAIIFPPDSKPLKLATCYNHPRHRVPEQLFEEFEKIHLNGVDLPGLFVGDFNSPHEAFGSRFTNEYGTSLLQIISRRNMIFFNDGSPTFIESKSSEPNVLDLVIGNVSMSSLVVSCKVEGNVGSDHYPVKTVLDLSSTPNPEKTSLNFSKWVRRLSEELENFDQSSQDIDTKLECLEKFLRTLGRNALML